MQITLNKQQEEFIAAQLAQGNFSHPDEVVNAAFKLLEKLQTEYPDWLTETREQVNLPPFSGSGEKANNV
ncbi:ribbon-helix-helix domain-containing protein [Arthrospira platensis]|jgi:antitoxin ParD1/3/4|uniref:CopG family transcriptional regulator n=1 Tax=Limnospira platensis NIES-46 TaxID=1236695 RepID=A0A5M3T2B3_LIMPL|nr:type II toxin-antitoxin system ParD family antitoxin [Arthrospira platensis]AMW26800.1 CopG family transcriptional regulator [Arthrospira platensis YZ]KDR58252.1 CopG family transcriptional regulator [Arthrospira platensis str. Paraca]MBD2669542.1 type II toxin-antitoxin system ParD family antitoxin [Arthrospira platensis FACHB-439]MBD2711046.1 type II toxin-antitoxin system ParD family antitoxin [Arthrospira platensis FACHB-835]MDF2211826.1 type II toxin-antitoxin system ParD family antito